MSTNECFICGRNCIIDEHTDADGEKFEWKEISDAVHFAATGNWGSTVWDPLRDDLYLNIYICDECLNKQRQRARVTKVHRRLDEEDQGTWPEWDPNK